MAAGKVLVCSVWQQRAVLRGAEKFKRHLHKRLVTDIDYIALEFSPGIDWQLTNDVTRGAINVTWKRAAHFSVCHCTYVKHAVQSVCVHQIYTPIRITYKTRKKEIDGKSDALCARKDGDCFRYELAVKLLRRKKKLYSFFSIHFSSFDEYARYTWRYFSFVFHRHRLRPASSATTLLAHCCSTHHLQASSFYFVFLYCDEISASSRVYKTRRAKSGRFSIVPPGIAAL